MTNLPRHWIPAAVAFVLLCWAVGAVHRLRALRAATIEAFSHVDVHLRRRHAQVQALLDALRPMLQSEQSTLDTAAAALQQVLVAAIAARARPTLAEAMGPLGAAEGALAGALARLTALVEHHPEILVREDVTALMGEMRDIDAKLVVARHVFNGASDRYNRAIHQLPTRLLAWPFRFRETGRL